MDVARGRVTGRVNDRVTAWRLVARRLKGAMGPDGFAVIQGPGSTRLVVIAAEEHDDLLGEHYRFTPRVDLTRSGASIWLPELALYGEGSTLSEAERNLVDAAMDYADQWEAGLRGSPNHVTKRGWVRRLQIAGTPERIHDLLFNEASEAEASRSA